MLYFEYNQYKSCKYKVIYVDNGERLENYVGQEGKEWWENLPSGIEVVEFVELEKPTNEQLERLEEVNQLNIGDGYSTIISDYVLDNQFPNEVNHPLRQLQIKKEQLQQDEYLIDLDFRQLLNEMGL